MASISFRFALGSGLVAAIVATGAAAQNQEVYRYVDKEGRVYEIFNEAMDLNLEFGSSDVKLVPQDHIDRSIINKIQ